MEWHGLLQRWTPDQKLLERSECTILPVRSRELDDEELKLNGNALVSGLNEFKVLVISCHYEASIILHNQVCDRIYEGDKTTDGSPLPFP